MNKSKQTKHDTNPKSLVPTIPYSSFAPLRLCVIKFRVIFFLTVLAVPCFAENEFSLRLAPAIEIPVGIENFNTGIGASASLDWAFWQFADHFNVGVNAGGHFASLPFVTGDPFTLMGGNLGLFLNYRPFDRWAFRIAANGGVYQYIRADHNETNPLFSGTLGTEFYLSPYFSLFADGGFTYRVFTSEPLNTLGISLGIRLNLSEIMGGRSRLRVERTKQNNVFPVSWAWYEKNPIAAITVTNEEPNTITDVRLSFYMDSFMSQPYTFAVVPRLAPGQSVEVPVTSLFNQAMMNLNETVNANGLLQTQYRSLGTSKTSAAPIQMPIFHRNTMSWDDDRRAAAFVSPNDFSARAFARYVETAVRDYLSRPVFPDTIPPKNMPQNVIYAAAIFEALRLYGISYIVDPSSSYVALSDDASALDSLNYPYETLKYRGGDCDDLSILFCSLLEALGIETAFITVPGHIFTAFEIGDNNWQKGNPDIIELYGHDGILRRWFPVEITVPAEGFTRAWRIGARQWKTAADTSTQTNAASGAAMLYPIHAAWTIYPSVTVPAPGGSLQGMPDKSAVIRSLVIEQRAISK